MSVPISPFQAPPPRKSQSIIFKVLVIIGLILGLLIPLNMIGGIIAERQSNKDKVQTEIAGTWADQQTVLGPILAIPYKSNYEYLDGNGQKQTRSLRQITYHLPQQYQVYSYIKPEIRYRGIYQSVVYITSFSAKGHFDLKSIHELNIPKENILWKEAYLVLGIPSMKGINHKPELMWQGKPLELLQGVNGTPFVNFGLYSPVTLSNNQLSVPFKLALSLKGSQKFSVVPIGNQNSITMDSSWSSPSFIGGILPSTRDITAKGFNATWEMPYAAKSYGHVFNNTSGIYERMLESAVGVQLLTPVDSYRQSDRAVKYGVLFLVLTFATYFLFEVISRYRLHPFQYLLVGCAISLFYLLLIAISEVSRFEFAYGIASVATITVITLYSKAILGKIRRHAQWLIGGLLSILYTYLYVLLQLEDLSLLFGAIGLFLVLAIIMYVTRNIDWYNEHLPA